MAAAEMMIDVCAREETAHIPLNIEFTISARTKFTCPRKQHNKTFKLSVAVGVRCMQWTRVIFWIQDRGAIHAIISFSFCFFF